MPKYRARRNAVSAVIPRRLVDNLADAGNRNVQLQREAVDRNSQRLHELLAEHFARVNRRTGDIPAAFRTLDAHIFASLRSVVIDDFHIIDAIVLPTETDAPLVVDANAMLPGPVALRASKRFPGGAFSSSSLVAESIWTSLRMATRAIEVQWRLFPVSKSALVSLSAKLLITSFSFYNGFRYIASVNSLAASRLKTKGFPPYRFGISKM